MIQSASILLYLFVALSNLVSFDKTVHDFGRVEASSDPLVCVYTFRNVSDSDVRVKYARASCSCLSLVWTTDAVRPGECGNVIAKYTRQYGENRFDKSFKVVFDGDAGSFDLSVRGAFYETAASLAPRFPYARGKLLFDREVIDAGTVSPGRTRLVALGVANAGIWSNPTYDECVQKSLQESDPVKAAAYAADAEKLFLEETPMIPLYLRNFESLVQPYVSGYQLGFNDGMEFNHLVVSKRDK